MNKKTTIVVLGAVAVGVLLLAWGNISSRTGTGSASATATGITRGTLGAPVPQFDFGSISMAKGNVERVFALANTTGNEVKITRAMTSCMCTTAYLKVGNEKELGPFGMPGHGFSPTFDMPVKPGETLTVRVVFDPAAHGPAGVGRVERMVEIGNDKGQLTEMQVAATVTP